MINLSYKISIERERRARYRNPPIFAAISYTVSKESLDSLYHQRALTRLSILNIPTPKPFLRGRKTYSRFYFDFHAQQYIFPSGRTENFQICRHSYFSYIWILKWKYFGRDRTQKRIESMRRNVSRNVFSYRNSAGRCCWAWRKVHRPWPPLPARTLLASLDRTSPSWRSPRSPDWSRSNPSPRFCRCPPRNKWPETQTRFSITITFQLTEFDIPSRHSFYHTRIELPRKK